MGVELSLLLHDPPEDVIRTAAALEEGKLQDSVVPMNEQPEGATPQITIQTTTNQIRQTSTDEDPGTPASSRMESVAEEDKVTPLSSSKLAKIEKWLASHKSFANLMDPQADAGLSREEYALNEQKLLDDLLKSSVMTNANLDDDRRLSVANVQALAPTAVTTANQFEEDLEVIGPQEPSKSSDDDQSQK
eukprot:PhF_6_TR19668/c0_g1_i1/m.28719